MIIEERLEFFDEVCVKNKLSTKNLIFGEKIFKNSIVLIVVTN